LNPWITIALCLLSVAHFATAFLLWRLTSRVVRLPSTVCRFVRAEVEADRDRMKEAVAAKVVQATVAIATYQEQLAADVRAKVAGAEVRARGAEARGAETAKALATATALLDKVRDLAELLAAVALDRATQPTPDPVGVAAPSPAPVPIPQPSRPDLGRSGVVPRVNEEDDDDSAEGTTLYERGPVHLAAILPPPVAAAGATAGGAR
jgi:hypothetical protein